MSQQINLFNPVLFQQQKPFSAVVMARILGVIVLGTVLFAAYASYQIYSLGKQSVATSIQLTSAQAQLAKVNVEFAPRPKSNALENEIQKVEAEVQSIQQIFDILKKGEFGNTKGYAEYMRAFSRQIVGGLWLTGFSIHGAGNEIGIQGKAIQPELVPAYIGKLKREPVLLGKTFATLEMLVPQVEATNKDDASGAKRQELAGYIDFNLQSSGLKSQTEAPGAKIK